jgi:CheY-like chemotaxis protein
MKDWNAPATPTNSILGAKVLNQTRNGIVCAQAETDMGNNKILVVEDDADYREMIMLFLLRSGYEGVEAATGFEAVSQARVTRPNLILMDLDMPAMTGDQATARLKADPSTRNIPVIVTTAFSYGSLVDRAITAGADEIMHKPFELKSLRVAMRRHLDYQPPCIPMRLREFQR